MIDENEMRTRSLAATLDEVLNGGGPDEDKYGFVLIVSPQSKPGEIHFASNTDNAGALAAAKDLVVQLERRSSVQREVEK